MKRPTIFGNTSIQTLSMLLLLGISSCTLPEGCRRKEPCGTFTFTGNSNDLRGSNSLPMELAFDFNPAACGSECSCNLVCYVQIVRNCDFDTGGYIYPSSEKEQRATATGWYIDRIPGRIWGYYGRNDNGTFASTVTPGSETVNAILRDEPSRPDAEPWLNFWWQAVSVPVCIQSGSACENRLLGYYFWGWIANADGTMSDPIHMVGWVALNAEFNAAVTRWNTQAVALSKNSFPAFTEL